MSINGFLNIYRAYIAPIIAILGISGNILVIIVFARKRISRFNIYSIAFLISHSLALFINSFLDDFLGRGLYFATKRKNYVKLDTISQKSCVFMEYLPNVMYFSSGFLLVIFTADRFIVLTWPFRFQGTGKIKTSIFSCLSIYILGFITAIPLALSHELIATTDKWNIENKSCQINTNDSRLASVSLYYESIVVFVLPTMLVFLLNMCIIYQILKISKIRSKLVVDKKMNKLEMSRIIGMLAVSSSFLLFTIPLSVVIIIRLRNEHSKIKNIRALSKLFSSLKDINYSINFLIYYTFLSYFKYDLKMLFSSSIYQFLTSTKSPDVEMDKRFDDNL